MVSEQVTAAAHFRCNLAAFPNTANLAAIHFPYQPAVIFDERLQRFVRVINASQILVFIQMLSDDLKLGRHEIFQTLTRGRLHLKLVHLYGVEPYPGTNLVRIRL